MSPTLTIAVLGTLAVALLAGCTSPLPSNSCYDAAQWHMARYADQTGYNDTAAAWHHQKAQAYANAESSDTIAGGGCPGWQDNRYAKGEGNRQ